MDILPLAARRAARSGIVLAACVLALSRPSAAQEPSPTPPVATAGDAPAAETPRSDAAPGASTPVLLPTAGAPTVAGRLPLIGQGRRCGTLAAPTCSLFWLPLLNFLVPGVGQFVDERNGWPYLLAGVGGLGGLVGTFPMWRGADFTSFLDPRTQAVSLIAEVWQTAGFLSIYETYRTRMVDDLGLTTRHSPMSEVLLSPVRFDRVVRPSVFVPLLVSVVLGVFAAREQLGGHPAFTAYRPLDAAASAGISYAAGVGEEAVFRGFFMSYLEHRWGCYPWLANGAQAIAFGAAHGDFSPFGLGGRILLGGYLGWVTQRNGYELIDAILIHTWWDVLQFTAMFAIATPADRPTLYLQLPAIPF